jgi:hypothetical protein
MEEMLYLSGHEANLLLRVCRYMAESSPPPRPSVPLVVEPSITTPSAPSDHPQTINTDSHDSILLSEPPRNPSLVTSIASSHGDIHTGKSWAESVEDPWLPLILTLDGGGIRGYSSLLILQHLIHLVARWETHFEQELPVEQRRVEPFDEKTILLCHYFDYMYGTSTGGLIATMLGRLRMNVPDCLDYYKKFGNDLFGHKRNPIPLATKYRHKPLEEAVKEIVRKHCPVHTSGSCNGEDWHPWHLDDAGEEPSFLEAYSEDTSERICQSICLTATHNKKISEAYLLRTYNHQYSMKTPDYIIRYNEGADKLQIWQVTRATSAAPFFFKALVADIENEKVTFKDGGIRENNPSVAAWSEFTSLYGNQKSPALLMSVGTGLPKEQDGFATAWPGPFGKLPAVKKVAETFAVFKNMLVKYTEGEARHQSMLHQAQGEWTWYKRLNVNAGMENMRLDNWEKSVETITVQKHGKEKAKKVVVPGGKSLKRMEDATNAYLTREVNHDLKEYAAPK